MIKRYSFNQEPVSWEEKDGKVYINDVFVEHPEGQFVSYDDYAVLFAKFVGQAKLASYYQTKLKELEDSLK